MNDRLVEISVDLSAICPDGVVRLLMVVPLCDDPDKFIDCVCTAIKDYVCERIEYGSPIYEEHLIEFLNRNYSILEKPITVALDFSVKVDRVEYTTERNIEHPRVLLGRD